MRHDAPVKDISLKPGKRVRMEAFDPDDTSLVPGGKQQAAKRNVDIQKRLTEGQELLFASSSHAVLIILQGMDTSGKDGTIRHVMGPFNPQGVQVTSFKKPTPTELAHDFLWRAHLAAPGKGEICVFNRSHYEDVLIVRVHDLVPKRVWKKRYHQINDFERLLVESGTVVLKFFLCISKDEQRKRLQERCDDPTKRWKFQHGDLEERKLWDDYMDAYRDALEKTSTEWAPWHIVPANHKWFRNYVVGSIVADALDALKLKYPKIDLGEVVIE
jgi:PPK2 family polyphosphate:nucleotide phosphotransferase